MKINIDDLYTSGFCETQVDFRNPFLIFCQGGTRRCNQCGTLSCGSSTGSTCEKASTYSGSTAIIEELDPSLDVFDNAIGFRIKDDGSIGYRSLVFTGFCSGDTTITGVTVEEEYSASGMVQDDVWTHIAIRFVMNETLDECELGFRKPRKGKLLFYVNCRLKLVVDDIDEFIARRLKEQNEKQLAVPFNISIGGGTQGLIESMTFDGQDPEDLGMDIEKNFAGSFIGDLTV